ncbi:MAG: hypothetical protein AAF993_08435 [Pseudomonadota bacterium]
MKNLSLALCVAVLITLAMVLLVVERGGLIAWAGLLGGACLTAKIWWKSARPDLAVSLILAALLVITWFGTHRYVIATWESGEVVELIIELPDRQHTARLWVMDIGEHPTVYYDAAPEVAAILLAGEPVQFRRAGQLSTRIPQTTAVDAMSAAQADRVLTAMQTKYGARNDAATVYYGLLGASRDRVAIVATLVDAP